LRNDLLAVGGARRATSNFLGYICGGPYDLTFPAAEATAFREALGCATSSTSTTTWAPQPVTALEHRLPGATRWGPAPVAAGGWRAPRRTQAGAALPSKNPPGFSRALVGGGGIRPETAAPAGGRAPPSRAGESDAPARASGPRLLDRGQLLSPSTSSTTAGKLVRAALG